MSGILNNARRIVVAAHDAGGAEVVSAWVRRCRDRHFDFVLDGPARAIFKRKLGRFRNHSPASLDKLIGLSDGLLTGTSWSADLEKHALRIARKKGKASAAFLDHWIEYPSRFRLRGKACLPDEIWVGDEYAFRIAKREFPLTPVVRKRNPYFLDLKESFRRRKPAARSPGHTRVLYVSEPISEQALREYGRADHFGYTEYEALRRFLEILQVESNKYEVRLRLHPSEKQGKYGRVLAAFPGLKTDVSSGSTLIDDCVWADWVAGCESMAMVIALLTGKKVFSVIPVAGVACSLPHTAISRI